MTKLDKHTAALCRIDALNIIQALTEGDRDKAKKIMTLYQDAPRLSGLAWVLANMARHHLDWYRAAGGNPDLNRIRAHFLSDLDDA
jgi:hypothetical protein